MVTIFINNWNYSAYYGIMQKFTRTLWWGVYNDNTVVDNGEFWFILEDVPAGYADLHAMITLASDLLNN